MDEIGRIQPSELLYSDGDARLRDRLYKEHPAIHFTVVSIETFSNAAESKLAADLAAQAGADAVRAASAILHYLEKNAVDSLKVLRELELYRASHYLVLDDGTRISLELTSDYRGDRKGSLLFILDRTVTPMGARRLRQWLLYPLTDETAIRARHEAVQELVASYALRQELKLSLVRIQDLERLAGRAVSGSALPKDLVAIKETLLAVGETRSVLGALQATLLVRVRDGLAELTELIDLIGRAIGSLTKSSTCGRMRKTGSADSRPKSGAAPAFIH